MRLRYEDDEFSKKCRYYTTSRYSKKIKTEDLDKYFELIKDIFYDRSQYKWKVKKAIAYIDDKYLDKYDVTVFLKDFIEQYIAHFKNGKHKDFKKFIENLQSNPKLNRGLGQGRIRLKKNVDILDFIEDLYQLGNNLETKHSFLIKMVYDNIGLPYSKKTFTRLYYDNINSAKK